MLKKSKRYESVEATDCRASLQQVAYFKVSIGGLQNSFQ